MRPNPAERRQHLPNDEYRCMILVDHAQSQVSKHRTCLAHSVGNRDVPVQQGQVQTKDVFVNVEEMFVFFYCDL